MAEAGSPTTAVWSTNAGLTGKEKILVWLLNFQTLMFRMTMVKQLAGSLKMAGIFQENFLQIHWALY